MTAEVVSKGIYSPVRSQELAVRENESGPIHPGSINLTSGLEDQFDDFDLSNSDETGDGGSVSLLLLYTILSFCFAENLFLRTYFRILDINFHLRIIILY